MLSGSVVDFLDRRDVEQHEPRHRALEGQEATGVRCADSGAVAAALCSPQGHSMHTGARSVFHSNAVFFEGPMCPIVALQYRVCLLGRDLPQFSDLRMKLRHPGADNDKPNAADRPT